MKLFREYQQASLIMTADGELESALRSAVGRYHVTHVLESGTAEGTGSTRMIAECFADREPEAFVTIEANWERWRKARHNLSRWPFIECVWGQTVPLKAAIDFIQHDEAILQHERYPELFIDDVTDPVGFYVRECRGERARSPWMGAAESFDRAWRHAGDHVLDEWLRRMKTHRPLIVLDSAGGVGWLEYQIVVKEMGDSSYLLLLDDIHHLKHFRSLAAVRRKADFTVLAENMEHGWALAGHRLAMTA